MLVCATILFLLTAVFGLTILVAVLQDRPANNLSLILHGAIATIAIGLMLSYVIIYGGSPLLNISLIIFILAALGGLSIFMLNKKKKKISKLLIVIHPLIAITALILLIIYVLP